MGGRDRVPSGSLPLFKVRNTFVEAGRRVENSEELDEDDFNAAAAAPHQRQVSEPVMHMQRRMSSVVGHTSSSASGIREEEELQEPEEERQEPETEKEPCRLQQQDGRSAREQVDDINFGSPAPFGRQETEMNWPSWGVPNDQHVPNDVRLSWSAVDDSLQPPSAAPMGGQRPALQEQEVMEQWTGMYTYQPMEVLVDRAPMPADSCTMPAPMQTTGGWQAAASFDPGLASAAMAAMQDAGGASGLGANGNGAPPPEWSSVHTVMLRNLPNKYTQQMLLEELNKSGFLGTFDFLYLPIDPETNANRGYAFVNFVDPASAWMLRIAYEGRKMSRFNSEKVVSVSPAALQGFEANYAHYSTSRVSRGDPALRPLFLRESSFRHSLPRSGAGRRRGGRRSAGSLIDMATRQQEERTAMVVANMQPFKQAFGAPSGAPASPSGAFYVGLNGKGGGWKRAPDVGQPQLGEGVGSGQPRCSASAADRGGADWAPKFCPYCGGKVQPEFRFCKFCGASLSLTDATVQGG